MAICRLGDADHAPCSCAVQHFNIVANMIVVCYYPLKREIRSADFADEHRFSAGWNNEETHPRG